MEFINSLKPSAPCPFNRFFASIGINYQEDLFNGFLPFYNELCKNHDLEEAHAQFKRKYTGNPQDFYCISAEDTFKVLSKRYFENSLTSANRSAQLKNYMKRQGRRSLTLEDRFRFYHQELPQKVQNTFQKHRKTFFMVDRFPQNIRLCAGLVPQYNIGSLANVSFEQISQSNLIWG